MRNQIIIYGLNTLNNLIEKAPQQVIEVYIEGEATNERLKNLMHKVKQLGLKSHCLNKEAFRKMVGEVVHQGVAAKVYAAEVLNEIDLYGLLDGLDVPPFLLILDGIQDPHNLGACLRTANAAGIHAVIAPKDQAVGLTPSVRKVASGAAELTPFVQITNLARTMRSLKERGIWLYGATDEANQTLFQANLTGAMAWVMGAEGKGLRRLTRENCDALYAIPMTGTVDCLNVSVATGVCLFEALRQRKMAG